MGLRTVFPAVRLAGREGFEPPEPVGPLVFKTRALNRSATCPYLVPEEGFEPPTISLQGSCSTVGATPAICVERDRETPVRTARTNAIGQSALRWIGLGHSNPPPCPMACEPIRQKAAVRVSSCLSQGRPVTPEERPQEPVERIRTGRHLRRCEKGGTNQPA